MKRNLWSILLPVALAFVLCVPGFAAETDSGAVQLGRLRELDELIATYYLGDVERYPLPDSLAARLEADPKLYAETAGKMFARLDDYSHYLTEEEYAEAFPPGVPYVGIGIEIDDSKEIGTYIAKPVTGSPAEAAGLQAGDLIVEVDGQDVTRFNYIDVGELIRGEAGTSVTLKVVRAGEPDVLTFTITRTPLSLPNVTARNLGDGVGYIHVAGFSSIWDVADFHEAYRNFPYDGVRSVIIDLRGNGGGMVDVAANMLYTFFKEEGTELFRLETKTEGPEVYTSYASGMWKPNGLYILIDETSASAAEIFAGVIQGQDAGTVIGTPSYGKARGQYHLDLDDGSVAIITTLSIQVAGIPDYNEVGLTPDLPVELGEEPYPIPALDPLSADSGVFKTSTRRTLALEQRLRALGYFSGTPDEYFDDYTRYAVRQFQISQELPALPYADAATLKALDAAIEALREEIVYIDTQFEKAHELALETAKLPFDQVLPRRDFTDN